MGSICIKDNTKVIEGKSGLKLLFSFNFNIHHRYHFQRVINHGDLAKLNYIVIEYFQVLNMQ